LIQPPRHEATKLDFETLWLRALVATQFFTKKKLAKAQGNHEPNFQKVNSSMVI